ncbi:hypothetical protein [uncultured Nitratireductor sp.]|uniref:hypothetical protein n=1 Tax=uncultured Nitratireductor sp. TaxID=520953 RepID=UPI00260E858E|nr:hypothetical protein [uncultured Nitratireductor sp.]
MQSIGQSKALVGQCETASNVFRPLSHVEAAALKAALVADGVNVAQTAYASIADAVLAISGKRFTWATIKLYYVAFYSVKALLMLDGVSIFYRGRTPYMIRARAGELFKKKSGNSHSVAFKEFRSSYNSDVLLSQPIAGVDPLEWIENLRNAASYNTAPFPDPQVPAHFVQQDARLRLHVSSYLTETVPVYPFQEDHALLAYPILSLRRLDQELQRQGKTVPISAHYRTIFTTAGCDVGPLNSLKAFNAE